MRKLLLLTGFCLLVTYDAFCQPDMTKGIPIAYTYYLAEVEDGEQPQYQYRPGSAAIFTPFFVPELNKYAAAFTTHIEKMRSATNYLGPLGAPSPMSLGYYSPEEAIKMIDNGKLERINTMYLDNANTSKVTFKAGGIYVDDQLRIQDGILIYPNDTIYTEDLETGEMFPSVVENKEPYLESIAGAGFIEEWEYDRNKARFEKDISYMQVLEPVYNELNGDYRGLRCLFNFKTGDFKKRFLGEEGMVKKDVESYVLFNLGFASTQDAMISTEMVATSMGYGYIEPTERYALLMDIFRSVKEGQAQVYDYDGISFDASKATKATATEFFAALTQKDTVYTVDIVTGEMVQEEVELESALRDIVGIRFFEDWYMDPDHLSLYKRIKWIVLLKELIDSDSGEVKGVAPFVPYYIKLNPRL